MDTIHDLAKECIRTDTVFESDPEDFYRRTDRILETTRQEDLRRAAADLKDEVSVHLYKRGLRILYALTLISLCEMDDWDQTASERAELYENIRLLREETRLLRDYGRFCLAQYSIRIGLREKFTVNSDLQGILHEAARLVRISKGSEEMLALFAEFLDVKCKSLDLEELGSIDNDFHDLDELFESNPLLDHARLKCTLLTYSKQLEKTKGGIQALQKTVDTRMSTVLAELLTNFYITGEIMELRFIQRFLLDYMSELPEAEARIGEYAQMLAFRSMNSPPAELVPMLSLGRDFLKLLPDLACVQTGYAGILYAGMQYLNAEGREKCRKELLRLIRIYPQNADLLGYYAAEVDHILRCGTQSDCRMRENEIESTLSVFLDTNEDLICAYARLLETGMKSKKLADAIHAMEVMDHLKQKHEGNSTVEKAYDSILEMLVKKTD